MSRFSRFLFRQPKEQTRARKTGTLLCSEKGCGNENACRCEYVDAKGRQCLTAWCPDHQIIIEQACLCRRHANTILALGIKGSPAAQHNLPDVFNRIPSLIGWLQIELDPRLQHLIDLYRSPTDEVEHPPVFSVTTVDGVTAWKSRWSFKDTKYRIVKIEISINEETATTVQVLVDGDVLYEAVPPWIEHREKGEEVAVAVDAYERVVFYASISNAIQDRIMQMYMGN